MIKERPILFSAEMVRAILEGRKTQTRRVIKQQPPFNESQGAWPSTVGLPWYDICKADSQQIHRIRCPYGNPGDRLWVRETFLKDGEDLYYRADGECCQQIPECQCASEGKPAWHPSIHMPRWASRIDLEVVSIRVQRVQEISGEDALDEGVSLDNKNMPGNNAVEFYRKKFAALWDSINKARGFGWADNPWVWAIEFRRIK